MKALSPFIVFLFLILETDVIFGHMCHDPFRPQEHLVLVPEKELIRLEETGEFRMYIENTFRSTLQEVRLFVESPAFDIKIEPPLIERLVPGERKFFLIKLKLREGFKPGDYSLRISADAKSAEIRPTIEKMDIVVDKIREEGVMPEVERLALPEKKPERPVKEVKPHEEDVEPQEEIEKAPQEVGEVVVKVEKLPFWKRAYFCIIFILLLLGILIWRKIK